MVQAERLGPNVGGHLAPCCTHRVNQGELSQCCFKHDDSNIDIVLVLSSSSLSCPPSTLSPLLDNSTTRSLKWLVD